MSGAIGSKEALGPALLAAQLPPRVEAEVRLAMKSSSLDNTHERAVMAWETLIATMACVTTASLGDRASDLTRNCVRKLERPQFGTWAGLLRESLRDARSAPSSPLASLVDGCHTRYRDDSVLAEWVENLRALPKPLVPKGQTVGDLLETMAEYRNRFQSTHFPPSPGVRRSNAHALVHALLAVARVAPPTGGYEVTVVQRLERETEYVAEVAPDSTRAIVEKIPLPVDLWMSLERGRVYLRGNDEFVPMTPFAAAKELDGHWTVGWLTGASGRKLFYTSTDTKFDVPGKLIWNKPEPDVDTGAEPRPVVLPHALTAPPPTIAPDGPAKPPSIDGDSLRSDAATLTVQGGPSDGKMYHLHGHASFVVGRAQDCHAVLPQDDHASSRYHFLLEVAPPTARLRDLRSLNGTQVNGQRYGGRGAPEAIVELSDGDVVTVGRTRVSVRLPHASRSRAVAPTAVMEEGEQSADRLGAIGYRSTCVVSANNKLERHRATCVADGTHAVAHVVSLARDPSAVSADTLLQHIERIRRLEHPAIAPLQRWSGASRRIAFIYGAAGRTLTEVARERALSSEQARAWLGGLARGLACAHAAGMVHRAIDPSMIWVASDGPRITGLGIEAALDDVGAAGFTITDSHRVVNTDFLPRELVIDVRCSSPTVDVFALGAAFYWALAGQAPRSASPSRDPFANVLTGESRPLISLAPHVPENLATAIDRAVATRAEDRHASMAALAEACESR